MQWGGQFDWDTMKKVLESEVKKINGYLATKAFQLKVRNSRLPSSTHWQV